MSLYRTRLKANSMSALNRPTSVSLVGWIIIALGAFGIYGAVSGTAMLQSGMYDKQMEEAKKIPVMAEIMKGIPRPTIAMYVGSAIAAAGQLICGVMMLRGKSIGRIGYIVLSFAALAVAWAGGIPLLFMIPSLVIQAILIICAFLPSANQFYAAQGRGDEVLELR